LLAQAFSAQAVAVGRDGQVLIAADAVLDGIRILVAVEQRLPGIGVLGLVEIAVGREGKALQPDGSEDIVAVGNLPGVNDRREDSDILFRGIGVGRPVRAPGLQAAPPL
jgi:hypothetical protein